jgi:hypothetical protein
MMSGTIRGGLVAFLFAMAACGSNTRPAEPQGGTAGVASSGDAGPPATPAGADAGPERPFASTPLEAQSLIQAQIDKRMKQLWVCVTDWRAKTGQAHKGIAVDIGIDQEGNLMGIATPNAKKGDLDPALRDCMMGVLRGMPFPRSHAGVITVRQTFEDSTVYQ